MELAWLVYFISMLEGLRFVIVGMIVISLFYIPMASLYMIIDCTEEDYHSETQRKRIKQLRLQIAKSIKTVFIIFTIATILSILLPSKKTAYIMVGAYAAQRIAESGEVKEVGTKVYKLINKQLDEYLVEEVKVSK